MIEQSTEVRGPLGCLAIPWQLGSAAMAFVEPPPSKSAVNRAGKALRGRFVRMSRREREDALSLVKHWRSAHGFPLNTFQMTLRKRAEACDPSALVAQRLKRLGAIDMKLRRFETMRLTEMQDLGGCRAILSSVDSVRRLAEQYREGPATQAPDAW